MSLKFLSPRGAVADVKELEYISALHQTCSSTDESFVDGSIDAADIKYYLISRHGIDVTKEHVRKVILSGLGGGDSEDDCLDIAEVVAILIIPALLSVVEGDEKFHVVKTRKDFLTKSGYNNHLSDMKSLSELQPSPTLIADVLKIILINVTGTSEPPLLTKKLITSIFAAYDEIGLLQDDELIEEMIQIASGGKSDARLDTEAFERALTEDVQKYDSKALLRLSTYFEDAFGSDVDAIFPETVFPALIESSETPDDYGENGDQQHVKNDVPAPQQVSTFASADFTAETFRAKGHTIALFFAVPLAYLNFFYLSKTEDVSVCNGDTFGCQIFHTVIQWVVLMFILSILGCIYLAGLSLGNHKSASLLENVGGITFAILTMVVPNIVRFNFYFFSNDQSDEVINIIARSLHVAIGVFIILNQLSNILKRFVPGSKMQESPMLGLMFKGSEAKAERMMKQAAAFKVNNMIRNAYKLHFDYSNVSESQVLLQSFKQGHATSNETEVSTHAKALLNFTNGKDDKELIGGFFWVWKQYFSGDLLDRHGVWIHSRLLAANILQFVTLILVVLVLGLYSSDLLNGLYSETEDPSVNYDSCYAVFNSTLCDYPSIPLGADNEKLGIATCFGVSVIPLVEGGCDSFFKEVPQYYQEQLDTMCGYLADGVDALLAEASDQPSFTSDLYGLGLEDFSLGLRDQCPDLYYSNYYAVTTDSTDAFYCAAAVTVCTEAEAYGSNGAMYAHCVLGFDNNDQLPGYFFGELCNGVPEIASMLSIDDLLPKAWMINVSFGVGFTVVILSISTIVLILIPSTVATVLKFRAGHFDSLHDPNFNIYRSQMEDMSFLLGIMFWGMLFSSVLLFVIITGFVFLLVWQFTRPYIISILSILIGICITLVFRIILIKSLGKFNYAGFYRKRPMVGNIATLALECWHIALTIGFMTARVIKIMLCAAFYVGRVDTPVLAEGGIGDTLDRFPHVYRKELLSTEAHRHPYIESLGFMYLLKLRHGDDFAKLSGSIWRLLFVFALMPWLRKYRIQTGDEDVMLEMMLKKLQLKYQPGEAGKSIAV